MHRDPMVLMHCLKLQKSAKWPLLYAQDEYQHISRSSQGETSLARHVRPPIDSILLHRHSHLPSDAMDATATALPVAQLTHIRSLFFLFLTLINKSFPRH